MKDHFHIQGQAVQGLSKDEPLTQQHNITSLKTWILMIFMTLNVQHLAAYTHLLA
jgi:hypothetical protein